jgi:hypothetical protein
MLGIFTSMLEGQFDPKRVNAIFQPFKPPSLVSLFNMKHFLEEDNELSSYSMVGFGTILKTVFSVTWYIVSPR